VAFVLSDHLIFPHSGCLPVDPFWATRRFSHWLDLSGLVWPTLGNQSDHCGISV